MNTDVSFYNTLLQEKITIKFLPYLKETNPKWKTKEFDIIVEAINNSDFSRFSDIPVRLTDRTIRKFFGNLPIGKNSLSILVLLVYRENEAFLNYFHLNYNNKLEFAWDAFLTFTSFQDSQIINKKNELENTVNFSDPLFFLYNLTNKNSTYLLLFFLIIYPLIIITWAYASNVWTDIDYPLNKSMGVYIGYFFYAISAAQLTLFNVHYKKLMQLTPIVDDKIINNRVKYFSLIIALTISVILHYNFIKDDLFGWCESEKGVISHLGIYHLCLYTFNLWIIFNFQYYFSCFSKLIRPLNKIDEFAKNEIKPYINKVLYSLSKLNIIYKNILISYGGFSILFFISLIIFEVKQPVFHLDIWQWIEIAIIMIFYVLFGFILYWNFFNKAINHFLKSTKQKLLARDFTNINFNNYILSLPQTVNHIDEYESGLRNTLIWIITIVIAFCIGLMFYLQMS